VEADANVVDMSMVFIFGGVPLTLQVTVMVPAVAGSRVTSADDADGAASAAADVLEAPERAGGLRVSVLPPSPQPTTTERRVTRATQTIFFTGFILRSASRRPVRPGARGILAMMPTPFTDFNTSRPPTSRVFCAPTRASCAE